MGTLKWVEKNRGSKKGGRGVVLVHTYQPLGCGTNQKDVDSAGTIYAQSFHHVA